LGGARTGAMSEAARTPAHLTDSAQGGITVCCLKHVASGVPQVKAAAVRVLDSPMYVGEKMIEVKTKEVEPITVMSLSFQGSYAQTEDKLDELIAWVMREGHPYCGFPMGIYYDDPAKVKEEDLRAEVCVPVAEEFEGREEIERKELPGTEVAYAIHQGPYEGIVDVYEAIFKWMEENGYRFRTELGTREVFHKIYGQVDSDEELVTEVQVPIEKA